MDGVVGHTKGLAYIQKIEWINCLLIDSVIKDPETKSKIEGDLFISIDRVRDNAKQQQTTIKDELHRVLVHGGSGGGGPRLGCRARGRGHHRTQAVVAGLVAQAAGRFRQLRDDRVRRVDDLRVAASTRRALANTLPSGTSAGDCPERSGCRRFAAKIFRF